MIIELKDRKAKKRGRKDAMIASLFIFQVQDVISFLDLKKGGNNTQSLLSLSPHGGGLCTFLFDYSYFL